MQQDIQPLPSPLPQCSADHTKEVLIAYDLVEETSSESNSEYVSRNTEKRGSTADINAYQRNYYEKHSNKKRLQHQQRQCLQNKNIVIPGKTLAILLDVVYKNGLGEQIKDQLSEDENDLCQQINAYVNGKSSSDEKLFTQ